VLFVKETRLRWCRSSGGFAASDADDAEDGEFGESGARDEDAVCGGIEIGRGDLNAVVQEREQIVWDDAFDGFPVGVAQTNPKAVELGTTEESFALWLEIIREVANKIDGANPGEGKLLMLAVRGQQVDGIGLSETRGIQIAAKGLFVGKENDDLLVSRGWGAVFQRNQSTNSRNG